MTSTIAVIGTGYVGLTTGACFSHLGHRVICADIVPEKVEQLQRGEIPIHEAGLAELVAEGLEAGTISFLLGAKNAVGDADFVYLCVPTPQAADVRAYCETYPIANNPNDCSMVPGPDGQTPASGCSATPGSRGTAAWWMLVGLAALLPRRR